MKDFIMRSFLEDTHIYVQHRSTESLLKLEISITANFPALGLANASGNAVRKNLLSERNVFRPSITLVLPGIGLLQGDHLEIYMNYGTCRS